MTVQKPQNLALRHFIFYDVVHPGSGEYSGYVRLRPNRHDGRFPLFQYLVGITGRCDHLFFCWIGVHDSRNYFGFFLYFLKRMREH